MFEIVGYSHLNFTNPDTGEFVDGYTLHFLGEEFSDSKSTGRSVLSKFFPKSKIHGDLKVGAFCEFEIRFDSKGIPKVSGVKIC